MSTMKLNYFKKSLYFILESQNSEEAGSLCYYWNCLLVPPANCEGASTYLGEIAGVGIWRLDIFLLPLTMNPGKITKAS